MFNEFSNSENSEMSWGKLLMITMEASRYHILNI